MPSKRTNDSVDRIVQDLGRRQNAEDIRNSMNERQIDEILSSAGINVDEPGSLSDVSIPELEVGGGNRPTDKFSTTMLDDILKDLPSMKQAAAYTSAAPKAASASAKQAEADPPRTVPYRRQTTAQPATQASTRPTARPATQAATRPETQPTTQPRQVQRAPAAETRPEPVNTPARPVRTAETRPAARPEGAQPANDTPVMQPASRQTLRQSPHQVTRQTGGDVGDTTRTGIIKGFLMKMAPEGAGSDSEALDEGKQQFVKYFGNSAAVVPDSKGRLHDPSRKKKRGLFGLANASDTGEFVPINVSLGGRDDQPENRDAYAAQDEQPYDEEEYSYDTDEAQEEYYPDAPEQPYTEQKLDPAELFAPQTRRSSGGKKGGLFSGLFGGKKKSAREELPIPEPREEPTSDTSELQLGGYEDDSFDERNDVPLEATSELSRTVIRSKYSGNTGTTAYNENINYSEDTGYAEYSGTKYVAPSAPVEQEPYSTMGGETLGFIRDAIRGKEEAASEKPLDEEFDADPEEETRQSEGRAYRKGRSTVEFMPGQKPAPKPADFMMDHRAEPVGEPVMTPLSQVRPGEQGEEVAGFTMRIGAENPAENTQDFLLAMSGGVPVEPQQAKPTAKHATQRDAKSVPVSPASDEYAEADAGYDSEYAPGYDQTIEQYETEPADSDTFGEIPAEVAQTLTGQVRLADIAARTATLQAEREAVTADRAEQYDIDDALPATDMQVEYSTDEPGFTGDYQPEEYPAQPEPGLTKEEVRRQAFVSDIASSINFDNDAVVAEEAARIKSLRGELPDEVPDDDGHYANAVNRLRGEGFDKAAPEEDEDAATFEETHTELRALGGLFGFGAKLRSEGKPGNTRPGILVPFGRNVAVRKDYDTLDDANAVRVELEQQVFMLGIAAIVSGVLGAVMLYFGTAAMGSVLPLPAPLDPAAGKTPLLVVLLLMLIVTGALAWRTLLEGAQGIFHSPSPDSMPALAFAGAFVQLIVFLIVPNEYDPKKCCLVAGPVALLLCMNCVGKLISAGTAAENFKLVSSGVNHAVAYRLRDAGVLHAITGGLSEPRPCVLVSRPTQLLKRFVASSSSHGTSDKNQQQFAWIIGVCGIISFLFTLIYRKNVGTAVTALAATLCIGAPLVGTLLSALPARLMQRSAAQIGAVIPGWKDIRQLGRINVIHTTAHDLFPSGCVGFSGIKPVNQDNIYQAIVYAASMLANAGENMRDVFVGMIGDTSKQLCKVDDLKIVPGKGCVGWIDGERVLIGNRTLMDDYSIKLPSAAYEQRHTVNQRRVIYLAVSGKLYSMFQVTYESDPDTAVVLDTLRRNGMSLIVDCDDFNCDASLLEAAYNLPVGSVKVLTAEEREAIEPATAWLPESEGNMLHLGSFSSFVGGLEAAAGAAEGERKSALVVSASVLFSCLLAIIMAISSGFAALQLPALVLYQAAWAVLAMIFPLLQRY